MGGVNTCGCMAVGGTPTVGFFMTKKGQNILHPLPPRAITERGRYHGTPSRLLCIQFVCLCKSDCASKKGARKKEAAAHAARSLTCARF